MFTPLDQTETHREDTAKKDKKCKRDKNDTIGAEAPTETTAEKKDKKATATRTPTKTSAEKKVGSHRHPTLPHYLVTLTNIPTDQGLEEECQGICIRHATYGRGR